ncbi:hypothetical protein N7466_001164 [Penicillium verhagenii]|uniref:uncharacterized protein n=1 Tax=Penicillium verhagenii TaxID=1562060 RepID=UPI0025451048|nr:uncharacterized protein N7466_001164 [Penicillium verhagenii]KAJ5948149.1 hypothetical protein N7466_001164 [Penicillium verhagenii]
MAPKAQALFSQIPPKSTGPRKSVLVIDHGSNKSGVIPAGFEDMESNAISPIIISPNGDMVIEYADPSSDKGSMLWQVSHDLLITKSIYFKNLLHPQKFSEGAKFAQQLKTIHASLESKPHASLKGSPNRVTLPVVVINPNSTIRLCGADILGLFLKVLCLESMDDPVRELFEDALKIESTSVIAKVIQIADSLNSPEALGRLLRSSGYQYGKKGSVSFSSFSPQLLNMSEDRIRQIILISSTLQNYDITRVMTHTLILLGSKYWHHGPHLPDDDYLAWQYLPERVEEELYYRRQCIMATIVDLQAYFLRAYGVLENVNTKPTPQFQCKAGLANGSQCDVFQAGQLVRFFIMRSKSVFLGSNLIDPEFTFNPGNEGSESQINQSDLFDSCDIISTLKTLKEYPDYHVDPNHGSCGIKRRITPIIPYIENMLLHPMSLVGVDYGKWREPSTHQATQWKTTTRAHCVEIGQSGFAIQNAENGPWRNLMAMGRDDTTCRLVFTARQHKWEV